jgi:hypothetical protein
MAAVEVERKQAEAAAETCSAKASKQGEGLRQYYHQHIHELQLQVRQKTHNLNRLEAQRNELNSRGILDPNPNSLLLLGLIGGSTCIFKPVRFRCGFGGFSIIL